MHKNYIDKYETDIPPNKIEKKDIKGSSIWLSHLSITILTHSYSTSSSDHNNTIILEVFQGIFKHFSCNHLKIRNIITYQCQREFNILNLGVHELV
jgi:hypothetical protein